jgi:predicted phosphohydrolase
MSVWAISDLHLAFGAPDKTMEAFGSAWKDYAEKIAANWKRLIAPEDLVLIAGDISWAMHLEDALIDLKWIDALPGTKVMIRGNHDYWWSSPKKLAQVIPPTIHFIQNNTFNWNEVSIGGTRLWDTPEYQFNPFLILQDNPRAREKTSQEFNREKEEKIFLRELERLKLSLSQLSPQAKIRIAMTHYPPISADLQPSRTSQLLEEYRVDYCIFGHLHSVKPKALPFGTARDVQYLFTSCDYLDFVPLKVL